MPDGCRTRLSQFLLGVTAGSLLAGCAPISMSDVASQYYQLPANTTVVVRQTIAIPPGTAHVVIQDGRIAGPSYFFVRRYEPFCELEVNDVIETEQQVRPGRFAAARIIRQQKLYGAQRPPVLLAANTATESANDSGIDTVLLANHNDGPSFVLNEVHLSLQSAEQPHVRELRCAGGWAFPSSVAYPTLAEMNHALGPLVSIEIN
jgi:hypothetical protein